MRQLRAGELIRHALVDVLREQEIHDEALLGVSITTIRSQLRAIYEKTQTRSHAEAMIALMSVLPVRR